MRPCPRRQSVGLIGIGLMGQAFAQRLFAAGFDVVGFDIDPQKGAWLESRGGRAAASIAEVARAASPILISVFSTDQVEEVVHQHVLPERSAGADPILLCTSTCDPDRVATLGARAAAGLRVPRSAGVGDQRAGAARRRRRADRRRSGTRGGSCARPRCAVRRPLPYRRRRRRRARQARRQSHPRAQPPGARRGAGVRRAARPRSEGVSAGGAGLGRLLAGDGHQGAKDARGRFLARGAGAPDPEGRSPHARPGARPRPGSAGARRACDVFSPPACVRRGDQDNSIIIEEIARRRQEI